MNARSLSNTRGCLPGGTSLYPHVAISKENVFRGPLAGLLTGTLHAAQQSVNAAFGTHRHWHVQCLLWPPSILSHALQGLLACQFEAQRRKEWQHCKHASQPFSMQLLASCILRSKPESSKNTVPGCSRGSVRGSSWSGGTARPRTYVIGCGSALCSPAPSPTPGGCGGRGWGARGLGGMTAPAMSPPSAATRHEAVPFGGLLPLPQSALTSGGPSQPAPTSGWSHARSMAGLASRDARPAGCPTCPPRACALTFARSMLGSSRPGSFHAWLLLSISATSSACSPVSGSKPFVEPLSDPRRRSTDRRPSAPMSASGAPAARGGRREGLAPRSRTGAAGTGTPLASLCCGACARGGRHAACDGLPLLPPPLPLLPGAPSAAAFNAAHAAATTSAGVGAAPTPHGSCPGHACASPPPGIPGIDCRMCEGLASRVRIAGSAPGTDCRMGLASRDIAKRQPGCGSAELQPPNSRAGLGCREPWRLGSASGRPAGGSSVAMPRAGLGPRLRRPAGGTSGSAGRIGSLDIGHGGGRDARTPTAGLSQRTGSGSTTAVNSLKQPRAGLAPRLQRPMPAASVRPQRLASSSWPLAPAMMAPSAARLPNAALVPPAATAISGGTAPAATGESVRSSAAAPELLPPGSLLADRGGRGGVLGGVPASDAPYANA
eukprot:365263-Chlamydomonas_euryale.AAC.15